MSELTETAHQFVDDVAHDLRTPLTVIEQYSSIIAEGMSGAVNDRQREQLSIITAASHEMADMVDDFLDSSKLKAGTLSVDRESHTVQELLDAVSPMLAVRAEPKGISINSAVADDTGKFFGDLSKAGRVLTNLGVNAIKVTPQGKPLKLWAKQAESGDVQIGVTDEGPGMKPEDLKVIFERFKQLAEPALDGTKGFGLGLSIVKQLTWLNLGAVEVQSEPGKGSTFSFTLPGDNWERILACYIESIQTVERPGDIRMLSIRSGGDTDPSMLRRLICSFCYPMDLVRQCPEEKAVNALGVCGDVDAWSKKLRESAAKFQKSLGRDAEELEIKPAGLWKRDGDKAELQAALLEALGAKSCYA